MAFWIFTMTGELEDFTKRIGDSKWPIYNRTQNRFKIARNDKIVFYLGGLNNGIILGTAKLASKVKKKSKDGDGDIGIKDIELWETPVLVKEHVESLDFIKIKKNWGVYFQGGVKSIEEKDYQQILNLNSN